MEKTWRWFGPNDEITLASLRQIGVEGIVTALHHVPNGEIWNTEEIRKLKTYIEERSLRWSVVESLPVCEGIKMGDASRDALIENYIESLKHLGQEGVRTVCYNFMPVIDWIRTDLYKQNPDGTRSLYFNYARFAYFDCYILQREGAFADYSPQILEEIEQIHRQITPEEKEELINNIIVKTQGFVNGNITEKDKQPVTLFKKLLAKYEGIDKDKLRENFKYFMSAVTPTAHQYGVNLCVHPDDPPFPVLGLPRIVTSEEDIIWLLQAVDVHENGLTFCAGSLSSGLQNDVPRLAEKFASRTHFVHLRSTQTDTNRNFIEASHLAGRAHLVEVIRIFEQEQQRRKAAGMSDWLIPMRPDHGALMLGDLEHNTFNPGYSFFGRMKALGELSGMMTAVQELCK